MSISRLLFCFVQGCIAILRQDAASVCSRTISAHTTICNKSERQPARQRNTYAHQPTKQHLWPRRKTYAATDVAIKSGIIWAGTERVCEEELDCRPWCCAAQ